MSFNSEESFENLCTTKNEFFEMSKCAYVFLASANAIPFEQLIVSSTRNQM